MLKGAMVQYQTRNDGTAKNTHSQSSMKQQPARAQFCCSLPSFSSYISPTSLVESEKISMAASSLWTHWVGQICPCTSRKLEATNADALGRSWRTSRPKQLPVYQKKKKLHADRTTHPSIVLVARPTVGRAGYYVRACGNAYVACYWRCVYDDVS